MRCPVALLASLTLAACGGAGCRQGEDVEPKDARATSVRPGGVGSIREMPCRSLLGG
jgi:hypothetical protein